MTNRRYLSRNNRGSRWWAGRISIGVIALVLSLVGIAILAGAVARAYLVEQYPPPGHLVDVNGQEMHLNCTGEGSPTVIMESGLGNFSIHWILVQSEVAGFTRVCTYDRSGYGWSELGLYPRTSETIVGELHELLAIAGVEKPYLLVGHSFGGLNMRLYAHHYPEEVIGMVLVDSIHEEHDIRLPEYGKAGAQLVRQFRLLAVLRSLGIVALFPEMIPNSGLPVEAFAQYAAIMATTRYFETSNAELLMLAESLSEYRVTNAPGLGEMPLIVISRGLDIPIPSVTEAENRRMEQVWQQMQSELVMLSSNSQHVIAERSGHDIALEQPELVVEAIRQLVGTRTADAGLNSEHGDLRQVLYP